MEVKLKNDRFGLGYEPTKLDIQAAIQSKMRNKGKRVHNPHIVEPTMTYPLTLNGQFIKEG